MIPKDACPLRRHRRLMAKRLLPLVASAMTIVMAMTSNFTHAESKNDAERPLHMDVDESGQAVEIRIVGASSEPLMLTYELVFEGDSRSRNRGCVQLGDGEMKTLATVRMSTRGAWTATLIVTGDRNYQQVVKASGS